MRSKRRSKTRKSRRSKKRKSFRRKFGSIIDDFENKHDKNLIENTVKTYNAGVEIFFKKYAEKYYEEKDIVVIKDLFEKFLSPLLLSGMINDLLYPETTEYVMKKYFDRTERPRLPTPEKLTSGINASLWALRNLSLETKAKILPLIQRINSPKYGPTIEYCKNVPRA